MTQQSNVLAPAPGSVKLDRLFDGNFIEYSSYVIRERAIPDIVDGMKPVQRRIMQTLHAIDDGRFHKVAGVVGETMKLHPHGDASIFSALVNLANKEYLIERQGNFGNIYTGDQASAPRYIECRLTPMARETLFNKDLTTFIDSYDGRTKEIVLLPAKIPLLLLLGAEGIAVGMATRIMPHNFCELLDAQKKILRGENFELAPDFPTGGIVDISEYQRGNGRIKCRARIVVKDDKTITITEIPHGTTTQSLMESIEKASRAGRIKISSVQDYTAENVEIEIKLSRGVYAGDTVKALYAFTDCEISISPNLTVIKDNMPVILGVDEVLHANTEALQDILRRELLFELSELRQKLHAKTLEQIFIAERIYKTIEEKKVYAEVQSAVALGLAPFAGQLEREISKEDIERLLELKIRRISRFDIDRQQKEIADIKKQIGKAEKNLAHLVDYTLSWLDGLLQRYGALYPRRTELSTFQEVAAREVALSNMSIAYDQEAGLLGNAVRGKATFSLNCSEYDKIFLLFKNGLYRVHAVMEKTFVGHDLLHACVVTPEIVFNIVYRDGDTGLSFAKRFQMPRFILEKDYRLFPAHADSMVQYYGVGPGARLELRLAAGRRAKAASIFLDWSEVLVKGVAALGKRVATRPVLEIRDLGVEEEEKQAGAGAPYPELPLPPSEGPDEQEEGPVWTGNQLRIF